MSLLYTSSLMVSICMIVTVIDSDGFRLTARNRQFSDSFKTNLESIYSIKYQDGFSFILNLISFLVKHPAFARLGTRNTKIVNNILILFIFIFLNYYISVIQI